MVLGRAAVVAVVCLERWRFARCSSTPLFSKQALAPTASIRSLMPPNICCHVRTHILADEGGECHLLRVLPSAKLGGKGLLDKAGSAGSRGLAGQRRLWLLGPTACTGHLTLLPKAPVTTLLQAGKLPRYISSIPPDLRQPGTHHLPPPSTHPPAPDQPPAPHLELLQRAGHQLPPAQLLRVRGEAVGP